MTERRRDTDLLFKALAGGIGTLLIVGLWTQLFPSLRRVDRLSEVAPRNSGQRP